MFGINYFKVANLIEKSLFLSKFLVKFLLFFNMFLSQLL